MLSYLEVCISTATVLEALRYALKEDDFTPGNASEEIVRTLLQRTFDPSVKNTIDLSHRLPFDGSSSSQTSSQVITESKQLKCNNTHDIPLD